MESRNQVNVELLPNTIDKHVNKRVFGKNLTSVSVFGFFSFMVIGLLTFHTHEFADIYFISLKIKTIHNKHRTLSDRTNANCTIDKDKTADSFWWSVHRP